jgi:methionine-S-sulfoxide reductase
MTTEKAILAGGCFWGVEDLVRKLPGVISTEVGYTGGDVANATYKNHGTHAEGIEIIFDPAKLSYSQLLEFFFQIHDPTTGRAMIPALLTAPQFFILMRSRRRRRKSLLPRWKPQKNGQGLSLLKLFLLAIFGRRKKSIRITC